MKAAIIAFAFIASFSASAQPFLAPCPAPDSVVTLYRDDADALALARTGLLVYFAYGRRNSRLAGR